MLDILIFIGFFFFLFERPKYRTHNAKAKSGCGVAKYVGCGLAKFGAAYLSMVPRGKAGCSAAE